MDAQDQADREAARRERIRASDAKFASEVEILLHALRQVAGNPSDENVNIAVVGCIDMAIVLRGLRR